MGDKLFNDNLVCHFKTSDHVEMAKKDINITVEVSTDQSTQKKELVVRLTDQCDPFFLFSLRLGEDEFLGYVCNLLSIQFNLVYFGHRLKSEQGLLVDFGAFPQKLVELLRLCQSEQMSDIPKYVLNLVSSQMQSNIGQLNQNFTQPMMINFVETNPFKHLVHLALRVMPAADKELKRYLADCLKTSKQDNIELKRQLAKANESLGGQLTSAQQTLAVKNAELERLRNESSLRDGEIKQRYEKMLEDEREKAYNDRAAMQLRFEKDRETWEQAHAKIVRELEGRQKEASTEAKDLGEKYHSLKLSVREWQSKASTYKEELDTLNRELAVFKKDSVVQTNDKHQLEKELERVRTKLDAMVEQFRDKEIGLNKCQQLVDAERDQKHALEEALEQTKAQILKQESTIKKLKAEVNKANEVISKLHDDNKNLREKVRLGLEVAQAQESKLKVAEGDVEEKKKLIADLTNQVTMKGDQLDLLRKEVEEVIAEKDDLKKQLDTNENMIQYLNKQLMEKQLAATTITNSHFQNTPPMSVSSVSSQRSSVKKVTFQGGDSDNVNSESLGDDLQRISPVHKLFDNRRRISPSASNRQPLADKK